jgi:hypothetical protein
MTRPTSPEDGGSDVLEEYKARDVPSFREEKLEVWGNERSVIAG